MGVIPFTGESYPEDTATWCGRHAIERAHCGCPGRTVRTPETVWTVQTDRCPGTVRDWLARFINPMTPADLDLLTLWVLHTHFVSVFYTTPRLMLSSPVPGAGKTTVLEHLERLALDPVNMSGISSPALITRMLDTGMRTILIDECDRTLRADKPGVEDLLAIINTGYKRGGKRPVLVSSPGGKWVVEEHPTYAPVAMAGRSPILPDDTVSRSITVMLLPDHNGEIEDSDWEMIEQEADDIRTLVTQWAEHNMDKIKDGLGPKQLPAGLKGRGKEKWKPLMRVAVACGQEWVERCQMLIERELQEAENDRESQLMTEVPSVALIRDLCDLWPASAFWPTADMLVTLRMESPDRWGPTDKYPKGLTAQRLGRYLANNMRVHSGHSVDRSCRGYWLSDVSPVAGRLGITTPDTPPSRPSRPSEPSEPSMCLTCGEPMSADLNGDGRHPGCAT